MDPGPEPQSIWIQILFGSGSTTLRTTRWDRQVLRVQIRFDYQHICCQTPIKPYTIRTGGEYCEHLLMASRWGRRGVTVFYGACTLNYLWLTLWAGAGADLLLLVLVEWSQDVATLGAVVLHHVQLGQHRGGTRHNTTRPDQLKHTTKYLILNSKLKIFYLNSTGTYGTTIHKLKKNKYNIVISLKNWTHEREYSTKLCSRLTELKALGHNQDFKKF